ncbi:hypothetical protein G5I_03357 [Acromyrmex echinatior]|uniref:Uncharacterized protein n=1 Tax=Acromyrmex echinatior TaxID=103372 RepID=F4WCS9_ACREC|nr:hypothetical protein G5I_03357 [Acromyrmex echinatior]
MAFKKTRNLTNQEIDAPHALTLTREILDNTVRLGLHLNGKMESGKVEANQNSWKDRNIDTTEIPTASRQCNSVAERKSTNSEERTDLGSRRGAPWGSILYFQIGVDCVS